MKRIALLTLLISTALSANAAVKGSYRVSDGQQMELYYGSPQQIRVTFGGESQLVLKDGKTWMLSRQGGQWLAVDMAQMGGVMAAFRNQTGMPDAQQMGDVSLKPLGRKETVAGYAGEVWELDDGEEKHEVVLSNHADVRELTQAWQQIATKIAQQFGVADVQQIEQVMKALPNQQTGLLRQGSNFILTGIDNNVAAADVGFPAGTQMMEIPAIPGLGNFGR